ncbi:MAG: alpha/beta hydrolase fold domain-containing protein [Pseudomonadales bacterium]|nr:alpha/beta hydrolase fold domain-containing protein [Pseudomonadales bacterium]
MKSTANSYNAAPTYCCLIISLLLLSCSDATELLENNDPSKYTVVEDLLWASPGDFDLTMDIYTPNTSTNGPSPVLVMFHGGGWLINDKSIMDQTAKYLATNSRYVVCNVNYRLLGDDDNTVMLNEIVEDAFGAVLWVQENIGRYGGDVNRVAVTGDSAGGHLSAMIVNMGDRLGSEGFEGNQLVFNPTYLPHGMTAENVAQSGGLNVQAAILSYGAYDIYQGALLGFEEITNPFWLMGGSWPRGIFGDQINARDNPEFYQAVSPSHNIPDAKQRRLPPQLLTVGSADTLVTPASVITYMTALQSAGHPTQYWEHEGRPHAFLDSGSNAMLGISFEADAPPALEVMINFLDALFYG